MNFATELEASLKEFLAAGLVDLHENGGRTSFAGGLSWEVRGDGEKPLLHLWAERFNVTRRVLAITDHPVIRGLQETFGTRRDLTVWLLSWRRTSEDASDCVSRGASTTLPPFDG